MPPVEQIGSPGLWAGFIAFVFVMLALDLGVFHRKAHVVGVREALVWSIVWIALATVFGVGVWTMHGPERGLEYFAGYLIEKSLSIDNVFVFVVIFASLGIPSIQQHRVLFWGILSALVLRAGMIFAGSALLQRFHWLIYVFGAFLVLTGVKLFLQRKHADGPTDSWAMRLVRRLIPSTDRLDGANFFTRVDGRLLATPLFLALVLVEFTDVIFAVDSIPAIFAVTSDPFIVFTSNIFAILGLRSLYFLLADLADRFRYLKVGLAFVLVFVGVKMSAVDFVKVPPLASLAVIAGILGVAVAASLMRSRAAAGTPGGAGTPPTAR
ncbi:MAG: TerC family protein [Planctomycetes bacterium]|nr:TerC family protein [Planctomycetota bacterium]